MSLPTFTYVHRLASRLDYRLLWRCWCVLCVGSQVVSGATVTRQVFVNFDGHFVGNSYLPAIGELDATGSFQKSGAATVTSGVADVPGNTNSASGFFFNSAPLPSLTTSNWIMEAIVKPDTVATSQPGAFNHVLDVRGDLFFRYNGNTAAPKFTQFGFWDGATEPVRTVSDLPIDRYSHIALVWSAASRTLESFVDGASQGTLSTGSYFATPSVNVGFGFFSRTGFMNRAFDGKLDAVAFSTFTGLFQTGFGSGADFQLDPKTAPATRLRLVVNNISGEVSIENTTSAAISINGYEITSVSGSLDVSSNGWRSLAAQNLDPMLGGDAPGETWQAGANVTSQGLLETFLLGSSTLAPGGRLSLGRAYNELVHNGDLAFSYRVAAQAGVVVGAVIYDSTPPPLLAGDYNNNGIVDAADYSTWRDGLGSGTNLPNDTTPGSVTTADYNVWAANFGAAATVVASTPVPEQSAWLLTLAMCLPIALLGAFRQRQKSLWQRIAALTCGALLGVQIAAAQSPPAAYLRVPTPRQLAWHQQEYYAFVHFGPNTFTNEEWGWSQSTPNIFNPTNLDTDQWAQTFVDAGMTGMILTAKHHDGMALWDTSTTTYKIANSSWAQQQLAGGLDPNVVRRAAQSAKSHGLNFGVYLSPWDMHRDPAVPKSHLNGTIYDEPQIFGDSTPGDYNDLYATQLTELLTMQLADGSPIEISEVWLDGASGTNTVQTFDWNRFRDIIRLHQPNAVMWGHQGVDARWVGNEDGVTAATNWHTISRTQDQARYSGSQLETGVRDGLYWTPAEADARLRGGWFFHPNEDPKSPSELMTMYLRSVGRSVNLLLDVPPDTTGQIAAEDRSALLAFKNSRDALLGQVLSISPGAVTASAVRGGNVSLYGPALATDDDVSSYWAMNDNQLTGSIEVDFGGVRSVEGFIVQEHIALGQRIGGYATDIWANGSYQQVVAGTSLGYKRIDVLPTSQETTRVRLRVTQANATPLISNFEVLGQVLLGATGDLNLDGQIDLTDWQLYAAWSGANLSGLSPTEARMRGDINGDGRNNLTDFDLFVTAYDQVHGAGALLVALQSVPEQSSKDLAIVLLGVAGLVQLGYRKVYPQSTTTKEYSQ